MISVDLRELRELTYRRIQKTAGRIGLGTDSLYRALSGKREFRIRELNRLSEELGVPIERFVRLDGQKKSAGGLSDARR